ncbi:MAG: nucleoside deaminase [Acidimicrobiaceae bacterium]|nr:nucleoside deaminase [Acidimicrobiaceae bacterium]MYB86140.1 nucleoside deaminase [Acidimicrobiaceae bacterium]MYI37302.1 nucleoside deaminase [Acidimicrobiaceae bacterium]
MTQPDPRRLLTLAYEQALRGLTEGGVPIGAALVDGEGAVLGAGCNGNVQHGDFLLHAETVAIRAAGALSDYSDTILVTTMTPCWYCSGLVRFLGIGAVVVGDSESWSDEALDWLATAGVSTTRLHDQDCVDMFNDWMATGPEAWLSLPSSSSGRKAEAD